MQHVRPHEGMHVAWLHDAAARKPAPAAILSDSSYVCSWCDYYVMILNVSVMKQHPGQMAGTGGMWGSRGKGFFRAAAPIRGMIYIMRL